MSEEKKDFELKEEELEKVNGGFGKEMVECLIFKAGDCFEDTMYKVKVKHDYLISIDEPQSIEVEVIVIASGITFETSTTSKNSIFVIDNFVGNNAW